MRLFVVGEFFTKDDEKESDTWAIVGVFDDYEKAFEQCTSDDFFIGPINLNTPTPSELQEWPDAHQPTVEGRLPDHKIQGYHSKSEMRRIETMRAGEKSKAFKE